MLIFGILVMAVVLAIYFFMQTAPFGAKLPGSAPERRLHSANFHQGQFRNRSLTPSLTEGANILTVLWKFLFGASKEKIPRSPLPTKKTDLLALQQGQNILVWFGHSSYFMQVDGLRLLVDPVFSGRASPLPFGTKSFKGTDVYTVDDLPEIDILFLTHDHWDHLDYETILRLKSKVKKIITALGVGAHLVAWGYPKEKITELDWDDQTDEDPRISVTSVSARHFSGRGLKRNQTLWSSFILRTKSKNLFIGGDSGYDTHFAAAGNKFGPFDLAILENGQYNAYWKYIHMTPEETVQAAMDLRAKKLLPVHWAKFSLSVHAWYEPIVRICRAAKENDVNLLHPMIGEAVDLDQDEFFGCWWEGIH